MAKRFNEYLIQSKSIIFSKPESKIKYIDLLKIQCMKLEEVAKRLVELCRAGDWEKAQNELYHPDIISKEPRETGGEISTGMNEIKEKNKKWADMALESHGAIISDPLIADGYFCVSMKNDVTLKEIGRVQSTELCVYEVVDGKIVSEQFFHK